MCGADVSGVSTEAAAPAPEPVETPAPPPVQPPVQTPAPPPPPAAQTPPPVPPVAVPPAAAAPPAHPPAAPLTGVLYAKAPLGPRLLALIADGIIAAALLPTGILLIYAGVAREEFSVAGMILAIIGGVWQLAYLLGRDASGGAGFGKRLAGLVVVSAENGAPVRAGSAIVRQVVLFALGLIPAIGSLIEPVMVLVDKDGRRLGDKAAKSQVARAMEVSARGFPVKTGKGAAIAVVLIALLISMVGSTVGGIAFARALAGSAGAWEADTSFDSGFDSGFDEDISADVPSDDVFESEQPVAEEPAPLEPETPVAPGSAVNPETAVEAVGNMLWALQQDDVDTARSYATRYFQEDGEWFFSPAGGALIQFEVVDAYQDAASWVVEVDEQWNSGPEKVFYFVIEEDGAARVDSLAWDE